MSEWDPERYLRFADERGRPFSDLVARIGGDPKKVVDLGCGPGQLTAGLLRRWPDAQVLGLDSSAAMIQAANQLAGDPRLRFRRQDLREWTPEPDTDVVLSNAALQWVPGHRNLFPNWISTLKPGSWFAFQVPGNFGEPSHRLLHELAADPRFRDWTAGVERPASADPEVYLEDLLGLGCTVDAWETTYFHLLSGPDPVFTWISATGARPVLQSLPEAERAIFVDEYRQALRTAYPSRAHGVVLPFRRIFVVAQMA